MSRPNGRALARRFRVLREPQAAGIPHDQGQRREGRQRLAEHDRAGAWAAAAMRGGERLVQVDVHGVGAEVAGPRLARDGVEVRAVAIEIGAGLVQRGGDLHHIALEQPAGVRVGEHHGGDVRPELLAHGLNADGSVLAGGHGAHREAEQSGGCRVGAVGRVRNEHDAPRIGLAARFERRADRDHAAKLAMRAGLGRKRHRLHAGQLKQPAAQLLHERQRALHRLLRLQRMDVGEARQPRHLLVQARIVLHRARAQRKDAGVDGVVLLAQADVVADGLRLRQAGQADGVAALKPAEAV